MSVSDGLKSRFTASKEVVAHEIRAQAAIKKIAMERSSSDVTASILRVGTPEVVALLLHTNSFEEKAVA